MLAPSKLVMSSASSTPQMRAKLRRTAALWRTCHSSSDCPAPYPVIIPVFTSPGQLASPQVSGRPRVRGGAPSSTGTARK